MSDSSPILGTMLEKTSIEPHHVGSNRRALRMNGPPSQDYGFSHPQLLHLFYLDSFIYQVSAAAPLLRPLGVAQPSSLVLYLGPSAAANNICLQHQPSTVSLYSHLEQLLSALLLSANFNTRMGPHIFAAELGAVRSGNLNWPNYAQNGSLRSALPQHLSASKALCSSPSFLRRLLRSFSSCC